MGPEEWENAFQGRFLEGSMSKNCDVILMCFAVAFSMCAGWAGLLSCEETGQSV